MDSTPGRFPLPLLGALGVVALTLGPLLVGYEPVGGDPDVLYRPFKYELVRALKDGGLPLWSDRLGVGVPLAAESHVAAFYPPNWAIYRALDAPSGYRLAMWLHYLALTVATFLYARALGLTLWGGALSALSFTLCGFQASHAVHEPFYNLLPYLPLSLMLAERYLADGRLVWLAGLALALGTQVTLGHFQIQMWTFGLVILTALWRARGRQTSWRRALGLVAATGWGAAVAAVQLALTWELTRFAQFSRPLVSMTIYAFPPGHWAQLALPGLFMGTPTEAWKPYWASQGSSSDEACLYVGTVPLILAVIGCLVKRDRALGLWRWVAALGFVLATMPHWWVEGYKLILHLPGFSLFRAPGRYILLPSLGLCLLAGRGFDRALPARRFWIGFALAALFGVAAFAWGLYWSSQPAVLKALGESGRQSWIAEAAATWLLALGVVAVWRSGKVSPWVPFLLTACELAYLYHNGTARWGWAIRFPDDSPVLRRLAEEKGVGLVTGWVRNVPVRLGLATADPYVGITPPNPNYLLDSTVHPELATFPFLPWLIRFGVTHGVFDDGTPTLPTEVIFRGEDPILESVLPRLDSTPRPRRWRIERYAYSFPAARAAIHVRESVGWYHMFPDLMEGPLENEVFFYPEDLPPDPPGPRARSARVVRWDGRSGEVEHDGTCDLVLRRAYYPGWSARINGGPSLPVVPADGGLQSIRLPGAGVSKVTVQYRPRFLVPAAAVSLTAAAAAGLVLGSAAVRRGLRPE
jgi:hypothetical protein